MRVFAFLGMSTAMLAAQAPAPSHDPLWPTDGFRVPIHAAPDDPVGGRYGTWASGDDYKVSFHDGMVFYPVLGADAPATIAVRWQTVSVRAGATELMRGPVLTRRAPWRYAYDHGGVIEAYDVLPDGVEQTFVIPSAPAGELVVEGRLLSSLHAQDRAAQHGKVQLVDDGGVARVQYGAAFAVDARGTSMSMTTEIKGDHVRLRLAAEDVAEASFPLVVDPLLTASTVGTYFGANAIWKPDIARDDVRNQLMVSICRAVSATDYDVYVRLMNDDFSGSSVVFTDVTTSWSTRNATCAFVGGAQRWCVALQREFSADEAIRVHAHDSGDFSLDTSVSYLTNLAGASSTLPDIGGSSAYAAGDDALVVYQVDFTTTKANTDNSAVYGVLFDAASESFGSQTRLSPAGVPVLVDADYERPAVTPESEGNGGPWIVAWQAYTNPGFGIPLMDDWDLTLAQVDTTGSVVGTASAGDYANKSTHNITPKVAGQDGRYMVTYGQQDNSGVKFADAAATFVEAQRFDWDDGAASPVLGPIGQVRGPAFPRLLNSGLAYDHDTRSHWCSVTSADGDVFADRLGYQCGIAEAVTVYSDPDQAAFPAAIFDDDADEFVLAYIVDNGSNDPVYGVRFAYKAASTNLVGLGCGGVMSAVNGPPHAGNEFFGIRLTGAPAKTSAALWIGLTPAATPLNYAGLTGCYLNVGSIVASIPATTDTTGQATFDWPLPAPATADVYAQWIFVSPGANPANLQTTSGLHVSVR